MFVFQSWLRQFVGDPVNWSHPLYSEACQLFTIYEFPASLLDEEPASSAGEPPLSAPPVTAWGSAPRRGVPRLAASRSGGSESGAKRGRDSQSGFVAVAQKVSGIGSDGSLELIRGKLSSTYVNISWIPLLSVRCVW